MLLSFSDIVVSFLIHFVLLYFVLYWICDNWLLFVPLLDTYSLLIVNHVLFPKIRENLHKVNMTNQINDFFNTYVSVN